MYRPANRSFIDAVRNAGVVVTEGSSGAHAAQGEDAGNQAVRGTLAFTGAVPPPIILPWVFLVVLLPVLLPVCTPAAASPFQLRNRAAWSAGFALGCSGVSDEIRIFFSQSECWKF